MRGVRSAGAMSVRRCLRESFVRGGITVEQTGRPETEKAPSGPRVEDFAVFQCRRCRAVLGDSLGLCAHCPQHRLLACLKVTRDVVVEDNLMVCVEGELIGCTYNKLHCRTCKAEVGFRLYCSKSLAYLRGLFSLFKDSITCYSLQTKATIDASKMIFPIVSLKEQIEKLKDDLIKVHIRTEVLMKKLDELTQQRTAAEKQVLLATRPGVHR